MVRGRALRGRILTLNPTFPILGPCVDEHPLPDQCGGPTSLCCSWEPAFVKAGSSGPVSRFHGESTVSVVLVTGEEKEARGDRNFAVIVSPPGTVVSVACVPPWWVRHTKPVPCPQQRSLCSGGSGALWGHQAPGLGPTDSFFPDSPILV